MYLVTYTFQPGGLEWFGKDWGRLSFSWVKLHKPCFIHARKKKGKEDGKKEEGKEKEKEGREGWKGGRGKKKMKGKGKEKGEGRGEKREMTAGCY